MKLISNAFADNTAIPGEYAFAIPEPIHHYALSSNRNPHLAWTDAPAGTQSFVLVCHDPDVPSVGDDVNQAGKRVAADLPRVDFYHWLLLDIPADTRQISAGSQSDGVTAKGKTGPQAADGLRHGLNDYSVWFAADPQMAGDYFGYDGPCPPWNDERLHHYIFTLYALDVARLEVQGALNGAAVLAALQGHVLAQASLTGTYTLAPKELLRVD